MNGYTTLAGNGRYEYEDRKSVFIGLCAPVSTESDALAFIEAVRKRYSDAKHHVYAYSLRENSIARFSDDREPQGTAGIPVLDALRKKEIVDAVIVVVRYFGGTLLGTGGLVRAYSASAVGAVENAGELNYDNYSFYEVELSYSDHGKATSVLEGGDFRVTDIRYTDRVSVFGKIKTALEDSFVKSLVETTGGRSSVKKINEKFDF